MQEFCARDCCVLLAAKFGWLFFNLKTYLSGWECSLTDTETFSSACLAVADRLPPSFPSNLLDGLCQGRWSGVLKFIIDTKSLPTDCDGRHMNQSSFNRC